MFCRHVFGNISGGFRGISPEIWNFRLKFFTWILRVRDRAKYQKPWKWKLNYGGNTEIIRKHFHDHHGKKIRVSLCFHAIIPLRKTFFFKRRLFLSKRAFKTIQGLLWQIQGLFKDIPQFFNFQGPCKPCVVECSTEWASKEVNDNNYNTW